MIAWKDLTKNGATIGLFCVVTAGTRGKRERNRSTGLGSEATGWVDGRIFPKKTSHLQKVDTLNQSIIQKQKLIYHSLR